jgi:hypothetical protein
MTGWFVLARPGAIAGRRSLFDVGPLSYGRLARWRCARWNGHVEGFGDPCMCGPSSTLLYPNGHLNEKAGLLKTRRTRCSRSDFRTPGWAGARPHVSARRVLPSGDLAGQSESSDRPLCHATDRLRGTAGRSRPQWTWLEFPNSTPLPGRLVRGAPARSSSAHRTRVRPLRIVGVVRAGTHCGREFVLPPP